MQLIKAVYINEISKIFARKKVVTACILFFVAVAVGQAITLLIKNFSGINVAGSSAFPILALSIFSYTLIPLFCILVAVDIFAGEFHQNTMKLIVSRPVSRFKIYLAKVLAVGTFLFFCLMLVMIFSLISTIIFAGIKIDFFHIFLAYLVNFFPIFAFILLCCLISNLVKSPTGSFMLSIVFFIALFLFGAVFARARSFFLLPYFDWFTFFTGNYINFTKILRTFLILISASAMLFAGGYYLFEKRDI